VAEVRALDRSTVMLIASVREQNRSGRVEAALRAAGLGVVCHDEVVMHVPIEVAERARQVALTSEVDVVVTVGGGSATGLGKAVVMNGSPVAGLPLIAVPTTY
jgi:maleylacetate reductase